MADINRNHIIELLADRKEFINSIDDKISEVSDNMSSDNPGAIVEYWLLNEYRDELLDGIITIEELEEAIDILERNNLMTFTNIGVLYIHNSGECDRLVSRIIEPYIFVAEHVSAELRNELLEIAVSQNDPMKWLGDRCKLIITIDDVESLNMGDPMDSTQKETFVACWNRLVEMGLSEMHIIAVMANIYAESRYSATNAQDDYGYGGLYNMEYNFQINDEIGYGILQWTLASRKEALLNFANNAGVPVSSLEIQLDYLQYEMEEGICVRNWPVFLGEDTLYGATNYFMDVIENPLVNNINERLQYANCIEQWYSQIK